LGVPVVLSRRLSRFLRGIALASLLALAGPVAPAGADPSVPAGFAVTSVTPGVSFTLPTCLAFLPDGRMLVGEKRGRVYLVSGGTRTLLWQSEGEVLDIGDSGVEDVAVGPHFADDGFVYILYDVDPDSAGPQDSREFGFGRLARYRMGADGASLDPSSRTILMGTDWSHGPVITAGIHTMGSLRFGADGSLLVSIGDGSTDTRADPGHCPTCPPDTGATSTAGLFGPGRTAADEDIGAFRAQDDSSLSGKILRIDPATGLGLPDNPWFDGDPAARQSKVWAKGFRNPYRFCVKPGTGGPGAGPGTLYAGDVGWSTYEELDVVPRPGLDYGWPCFEGRDELEEYGFVRPKAFACSGLAASAVTMPAVTCSHIDPSLSLPPGLLGNCVIGGAFDTGTSFPAGYRGHYFYGDYGQDWLADAVFDSTDALVSIETFATSLGGPTAFAWDPHTGDLCYVAIGAQQVRRIHWVGLGARPPVAVASATSPDSGRAPLSVGFTAAASSDPQGSALSYLWSFGDRTTSTDPAPTHVYAGGGLYDAVLTVTDSLGASASDTVRVTVTGPRRFPSTPVLDGFDRADGAPGAPWRVSAAGLALRDSALDASGSGMATASWSGGAFGADQEAYVTLR